MISHSKPTVTDVKEINKFINRILKTNYLAEGHFVSEFEKKLSEKFRCKYAIATSSGTSALHLSLLALGVNEDSEVIVPAFSCNAILNAVLYCKAKPVIVDVNLDDLNISFEEVKKNITKKTKAIIVPHMFGFPAKDVKKIVNLGIPVVEDTTQSLGAEIYGRQVGSFGCLNVISFYATKMITTFGEGGAILTNEYKLYEAIKDLKEYDKKNKFWLRFNYKITEVQAAMGLIQLKRLPYFVNKRRKIFKRYESEFKEVKKIEVITPLKNVQNVHYRMLIKLKNYEINKVILEFKKLGVEVKRPIYLPLDKYFFDKFVCKNSKTLYDTTLSLPIYPSLREVEIEKVIKVVKKIFV